MLNQLRNLSIYLIMIIFLIIISIVGVFNFGTISLKQILIIPIVALISDTGINFIKFRKLKLSESAIISGLIIALILDPTTSLFVQILVPIIGIILKHFIRLANKPIFNPAMFSLVICRYIFSSSLSWWGMGTLLTIPLGLIVSYKIKKLELSLVFLATYMFLFVGFHSLIEEMTPSILDEISAGNSIFFAFFMLTEPKTTPFPKNGKIFFGFSTAVIAFIFHVFFPSADFLLLSLLVMNPFTILFNKKFR